MTDINAGRVEYWYVVNLIGPITTLNKPLDLLGSRQYEVCRLLKEAPSLFSLELI